MFPGTGHLPFPACDVILSQAIFNPGPGRSAPLPVNTAQMTVLESCEGGSPEACRAQARGPGLPRGETCPCESTRPSPPQHVGSQEPAVTNTAWGSGSLRQGPTEQLAEWVEPKLRGWDRKQLPWAGDPSEPSP